MSRLRFSYLVLVVAFSRPLSAQTLYAPGGTVGNISGSNVGIGTANPAARKLQIYDSSSDASTGIMIESAGTGGFENADLVLKTTTRLWQLSNGKVNPANGFVISDVTAGVVRLAIDTSGNVGIGTASPGARLEVSGSTNGYQNTLNLTNTSNGTSALNRLMLGNDASPGTGQIVVYGSQHSTRPNYVNIENAGPYPLLLGTNDTERMRIDSNGNVGIGTTNPANTLDVKSTGSSTVIGLKTGAQAADAFRLMDADGSLRISNGASANLVALVGGNVGIGTTNPTQKLSVNGTIRAKEVIVDTGWSDYVFKPDYPLASLGEVETAIKRDGHLPGIPSAQEIAEHGVTLGDMQSKLVAKIEELTLHQIEQEKRLNSQSDRLQKLETENAALRANRP